MCPARAEYPTNDGDRSVAILEAAHMDSAMKHHYIPTFECFFKDNDPELNAYMARRLLNMHCKVGRHEKKHHGHNAVVSRKY
jgi:hypothetical protein